MKKTTVSLAVLFGLCICFSSNSFAYEEDMYMNWSYATGEEGAPRPVKQVTQTTQNTQTASFSQNAYSPSYQIVNQTGYASNTRTGDYFGQVASMGGMAPTSTMAGAGSNAHAAGYAPSYQVMCDGQNTNGCVGNAYGFAPGTSLDIMTTGRGQIEVPVMSGGVQYVNAPVRVQYPVTKQYPVSVQYPVTIQRDVTVQRPVVMQQPIIVQRPVVMQQPVMVKHQPVMVQQQPIYMQQQPTYIQQQPVVVGGGMMGACNGQGC